MPELAGLDDVPWAKLRHAYGRADDIPELLRALAEGDHAAFEELNGTIYHQGTLYSATPPAVPFLLQLVLDDEVRADTRLWLTHLLGWIAGTDAHAFDGRQTTEGQRYLAESRAAIRATLPRLLERLDRETDDNRRVALVALLAVFPEEADVVEPGVRRLCDDERDPRRGLFYRVALASLRGDRDAVPLDELPDELYEDEDRADVASDDDPRRAIRRVLDDLVGYASDL